MFSNTAFAQLWKNPYIRVGFWLLILYVGYLLFGRVQSIVTLALTGYTIAYLFHPMLSFLERYRISRGFGILLVFLIIVAFIVAATFLFIEVVNQFTALLSQLPKLYTTYIQPWLQNAITWINEHREIPQLKSLAGNLDELIKNASNTLAGQAKGLLEGFFSSGGAIVSGVVSITQYIFQGVILLILSAYLMGDFKKIGTTLINIFPKAYQNIAQEISEHISTAIGGYLRGQILIATAVGVMIALGLALIGVPNALALGFLAATFNIVPYLGVVIAIVPSILLGLTVSTITALLVVVVFVVVNQLEGNFLSPYILGRTTNLHPATVLLSIMVGLTLFGIVGALLGVPLAAFGKLMLQTYYYPSRTYRRKVPVLTETGEFEPLESSIIPSIIIVPEQIRRGRGNPEPTVEILSEPLEPNEPQS
jgi:predicted PurR-regulated permease PerM